MSKGSAPPAPDYTAAANAQGQQSQTLAAQQTWANRPDVNTPWGNLSYTQNSAIDPATGQPVTQWGENVSLTPEEQQAVTNQQTMQTGRSNIATNMLNTVGSEMNQPPGTVAPTTQMTGAGQGMQYNPNSFDPAAEQATWGEFQNMEMPLQHQQTQGEESQLETQGLRPGDAAYNTAMNNLNNTQFSQDQTAADQAVLSGEQQGSNLFNEANAAQAQGFGQRFGQTQYNNSLIPQDIQNQEAMLGMGQERAGYNLNLMNSLMSGQQVGMPSFPGSTSASSGQAADLLRATENQGQASLNSYNAQAGQANSTDGAIIGAVGTALSFY